MRYDPFAAGPFPVLVRDFEAQDAARGRTFPTRVWHPEGASGKLPLVLYSHHSGGHRKVAEYLCAHLASHGYAVAALDHSETVAPELKRSANEDRDRKAARMEAVIASRVPDLRFLLDTILAQSDFAIDGERIGAVGHSFGGWTVLAALDVEPRIRAVVSHAPGGNANPRPGILKAPLKFAWLREVPVLYLVAENDVSLPLDGMFEIYEKTPPAKQMFILHRADHMHFVDDVEVKHEAIRAMKVPEEYAWMQREMLPIADLSTGEQAHTFVKGLTLAHLDAHLRGREAAHTLLSGDVVAVLAQFGVHASRR